ncbi:hypothetical protein JHL22_07095 [Advenella sp. WQ 585]|uniref:Transcriptional regulator n=1 Tax=Advenella mandrilli TaxID=2800330 RepID=A0ABS1ED35_9BURK|nr:hypothetical protein [Advenella mandrilli]MBK1780978.1 hypothetical protein [Advenella mandrilli]
MKVINLKNALPASLIAHDQLAYLLGKSVRNVNDKIANLVNNGDLVRLKKGFYVFSKEYRNQSLDLIAIANGLYAPSYVSFEYALSLYGMIPERVSEITSATIKNNKLFVTPVGRFSYKKIPLQAYALGVDWRYDKIEGGRFIATAEKALCDKIKYTKGIGTLNQAQMLEFLNDDLRLDLLNSLDIELIVAIAAAYKSKNLKTLAVLLKKGKL